MRRENEVVALLLCVGRGCAQQGATGAAPGGVCVQETPGQAAAGDALERRLGREGASD